MYNSNLIPVEHRCAYVSGKARAVRVKPRVDSETETDSSKNAAKEYNR